MNKDPCKTRDIAVVGMACRFPDAPNPEIFWQNLVAKKQSKKVIPKTRWDWQKCANDLAADGHAEKSKWGARMKR